MDKKDAIALGPTKLVRTLSMSSITWLLEPGSGCDKTDAFYELCCEAYEELQKQQAPETD